MCTVIVNGSTKAALPTCLHFVPWQSVLHPHAFADWALTVVPEGLHGVVSIFRNWTFSLFYIIGELWGGVVISLLFWG